ncbi:S-protein homolog 21 [Linum perenne]
MAATIQVTNRLNLVLLVHSWSKDGDLKAHHISVGSEISWSFEPDVFFRHTLFWCNLVVQDKRLSFVAFELRMGIYPSAVYWVVKDDGLYQNGTHSGLESFSSRWNS